MRRGGRLLQKGGSTAKLSLAVSMAERLFMFDSFVGLLPNDEPHVHLRARLVLGHHADVR